MSIEVMKQMIELYDKHCHNNDYGGIEFNKKHGYKFNEAIEALRTALSQQPATGEPVYWEWRHLSTHPDTVDFGKWSKWQRVEARSAIHTIDDALAEFRAYIAQGYKYELRALYDHPAPSAAVTPEPVVSRNPFAARCYTMSESHLSGHRLIVGFEKLGDAQDAHEWVARQGRGDFTHPAPSVPDEKPLPDLMMASYHEAIGWNACRAAMLAAK